MSQPMNLEVLSQQMFAMRDELTAAASKMETSEVSRTSGGVTVTLTGGGAMRSIRIDPAATRDIADLERHVVLAHEAASAAIKQMADATLGPLRDFVARATGT